MATQARNEINETHYRALASALDDGLASRLDALLIVNAGKSGWEELKREPKQPTTGAIASFLKHIEGIRKLADGLPAVPAMLPVSKRAQLVTDARALDVAELRVLKPVKCHALAVSSFWRSFRKRSTTSRRSSSR